jgi:hypothetical protein
MAAELRRLEWPRREVGAVANNARGEALREVARDAVGVRYEHRHRTGRRGRSRAPARLSPAGAQKLLLTLRPVADEATADLVRGPPRCAAEREPRHKSWRRSQGDRLIRLRGSRARTSRHHCGTVHPQLAGGGAVKKGFVRRNSWVVLGPCPVNCGAEDCFTCRTEHDR